MYVLVIGTAMILAITGVSALTVTRTQTRAVTGVNDAREAGVLAFSAIEHALTVLDAATIDDDPLWRTTYAGGVENPPIVLGRGTISFALVDPDDGDLADDDSDSVRLYGIGRVGEATRVYSVLLAPNSGEGLEVLRTAAHANGNYVHAAQADDQLTVIGGPLSCNATLLNSGTIVGNVEANTVINNGSITGTIDSDVPLKDTPGSAVFERYKAMATVIPQNVWNPDGDFRFDPGVLGRTINPYGTPNPDGVYYIYIPAWEDLRIWKSRIAATLVVECAWDAKVRVQDVRWERNGNLPALIIKGSYMRIWLRPSGEISEATLLTNLNPPGLPYEGVSDEDLADTYPCEVLGLVHAIGSGVGVELGDGLEVTGTVISEGTIQSGSAMTQTHVELTVDPELYNDPPPGYITGRVMVPLPGTWQRDELP